MTAPGTYAMRRLVAVLTLAFVVIWITLALDSAAADGGQYRGGREEGDSPTTVQATGGSTDMYAPQNFSEVEEDGLTQRHQVKTYGTGDVGIEVRWFHPQTGELIYAATYDAKTGEYLGGHD